MSRESPYYWLVRGAAALLLGGWVMADVDERVDLSLSVDQQDLASARSAIVDEHYAEAIKICERMLRRNETDVNALKIKGSAYYLLNEPTRALRVWERALQLSPNDQDLLDFMPKVMPNP